MLSKEAISEVTDKLLQEHPENRVALAPFSIRDSSMVTHLNYNSQRMKNFRDNLVLKIMNMATLAQVREPPLKQTAQSVATIFLL